LKLQAEQKAKLAAEKAAKLAPDKVKLLDLMKRIDDLKRPEVKSPESILILSNVNELLAKVNRYILENVNKL
jgi:hypothetical protein